MDQVLANFVTLKVLLLTKMGTYWLLIVTITMSKSFHHADGKLIKSVGMDHCSSMDLFILPLVTMAGSLLVIMETTESRS